MSDVNAAGNDFRISHQSTLNSNKRANSVGSLLDSRKLGEVGAGGGEECERRGMPAATWCDRPLCGRWVWAPTPSPGVPSRFARMS
eukprot:scaffold238475_cov41-Tisochrysis_lutea.AAC.1